MGIVTSQKISTFYDRFKDISVTFTKEIIQVTGLLTQQIHLKCGNDFWPCVIYATSFENAKIVANVKAGLLGKLQSANNFVNLRFCFRPQGETNALTFFIAGRVLANAPYGNSQDINMFTIQFSNRPPDDFIEIMGRVLDATVNSAKRKDVRIPLTQDNLRILNMMSTESSVFIEKVPRRCILRDLSFSGSKIIMMGIAKFLLNKEAALRIDFNEPKEVFTIRGKIIRAENVEGKKEMIALGIIFEENEIPMGYKIRLNDVLSVTRADLRGTGLEENAAGTLPENTAPPTPPPSPPPTPPVATAAPAPAATADATPTPAAPATPAVTAPTAPAAPPPAAETPKT